MSQQEPRKKATEGFPFIQPPSLECFDFRLQVLHFFILVKIFHFLESVADEDDLIELQQAGFQLRKTNSRKKSKKTQLAAAEQQGVIIAGGST